MVVHTRHRADFGQIPRQYIPNLIGAHPHIDCPRPRILAPDSLHGLMEKNFLAGRPDAPGRLRRIGQPRQHRNGQRPGKAEKGLQFAKVVPRIVYYENEGSLAGDRFRTFGWLCRWPYCGLDDPG
ncbi:hypothetical protein FACS189485_07760 [Spirochaetia bacterium]|nr:hypothetical protein FACS189485_07760 [Spirochaetia bacterium]